MVPAGQRGGGLLDEGAIQDVVQSVLLGAHAVKGRAGPRLGHHERVGQVQTTSLPMLDGTTGVEQVGAADRLLDAAQPQAGEELAHLLGDVAEEGDDELGTCGETLAQQRILRGHAHRAGVQVALAHHDAP